ncbi:flagellar motor protein MotB [Sphingobium bisphenolivorans]|uniref:flagellar motor protein MotB n=1 Tax=Sphingobium bisphenolivorans TaxID=1335760 RepID=UPI0003A4CA6B|nr:flagellar motor protein MotB [Sphingobium bisphenolivorans]
MLASAARRSRWALSFADLLLLLLGFFVMLQAGGRHRDAMLAEVRQQFGGRPVEQALDIRAVELFQPGEAMLTQAGRVRIAALARSAPAAKLEISSLGTDPARERFDSWDLAAARLGAVARALQTEGIAEKRLMIRGLDQLDGGAGKGQTIRIVTAPLERR